jgi:hypothetical protein
MPAVLPGQPQDEQRQADDGWVPLSVREARAREAVCPAIPATARTDDDVQLLVADGPGDDDLSDLTPPTAASTVELADWERYLSWREGAMGTALSLRTATADYGTLTGPTPIADDLRRDRELLDVANGCLVRRVRALEGQLRALGVEPVASE